MTTHTEAKMKLISTATKQVLPGTLIRAKQGGEGPMLYVKTEGAQPESVNVYRDPDAIRVEFRGVPVCRECHVATFGEYCENHQR